ncbi:RNA polymerase subunit sigma [Nonlabens spongiae]|uniref:RNA polymerase subunit sigma n=1 Tax=Nonlabens spongiae TaxID=331648 RepID=A0A1W6MM63_9FLAO|nr:RNA polymerase sigma factor [Nonlabens spongiae]ARN78589.1 RNA polymerase subunit sigma [Nonlabens spongiae]
MSQKTEFQELYSNFKEKVYRLCLGYLKGHEALAVDLTQEVFIKVHEHWSSFKGNSSRATWLYRIAVNTCLNQLRRDKKYKKVSLDQLHDRAVFQESKDNSTHNFTELYRCINKLNAVNKSIILLELEEVPQQEIAEIIGINHGAVRTRINRIKDQLSKCINYERS